MKTICRQAGLELELNNHSITVLDVNKFSNRDIMSVSGHRSETSLKTYTSRVSVQKKHEMSMALTEAVIPKVTTETVNEHVIVNEAERSIVCDGIIHLTPAEIEEFMVPMECERPLNLNIQVPKEVTPETVTTLVRQELSDIANVMKCVSDNNMGFMPYITGCVVNFNVNCSK